MTALLELEGIMLSERCYVEKEKYFMVSHIYRIFKKKNKEGGKTHRNKEKKSGC